MRHQTHQNLCSIPTDLVTPVGDGALLGVTMIIISERNKKRFWAKVDKTPGLGPSGECWEWTAAIRKPSDGYGAFWFNRRHHAAHRISYLICNGPIPKGLLILHRCHNPVCVNPDHLYCGTHDDNMQDMVDAGRRTKKEGEKHPSSKLTDKNISEIRKKYIPWKYTMQRIANEYGVGLGTIFDIINHRTWKHVR